MSSWGVDGRLHRCLVFCAQICATVAFIVGLTAWANVALASSPVQRADARYDYDAAATVARSDAANPGALVVRVVSLDGDAAPGSGVGAHAYDSARSLVAPSTTSLVDDVVTTGRTASTAWGRTIDDLEKYADQWRRVSAHAEGATGRAYRGGTSIEEVFERGGDRLVRHRIYGPNGEILHETFRPYAKFGAP